jgi:uncharacterized protein YecE (DUF72 family)
MAAADATPSGFVVSGTCGWSDESLAKCGKFYPRMLANKNAAERLAFYSKRFATVEIDTSTYAIPSPERIRDWASRTPPGFVFSIKAFGLFAGLRCQGAALPFNAKDLLGTAPPPSVSYHALPPDVLSAVWERFNDSVGVLVGAGKLATVVFQFNRAFAPTAENAMHICECRKRLHPEAKMAVEFRAHEWFAGAWGEPTALAEEGGSAEWAAQCKPGFDAAKVLVDAGITSREVTDRAVSRTVGSELSRLCSLTPRVTDEGSPEDAAAVSCSQPPCVVAGEVQILTQMEETLRLLKALDAALVAADDLDHEHNSRAPRPLSGAPGVVLPVHMHLTSSTHCYLRVHRREGSNRLLSPEHLDRWAARIRAAHELSGGGVCPPVCYVMWGTDWEDQPLQNDAALHKRLPDIWTSWEDVMAAKDAKKGLMKFFQAGAKIPPSSQSSDDSKASASSSAKAAPKPASSPQRPAKRPREVMASPAKGSLAAAFAKASPAKRPP